MWRQEDAAADGATGAQRFAGSDRNSDAECLVDRLQRRVRGRENDLSGIPPIREWFRSVFAVRMVGLQKQPGLENLIAHSDEPTANPKNRPLSFQSLIRVAVLM